MDPHNDYQGSLQSPPSPSHIPESTLNQDPVHPVSLTTESLLYHDPLQEKKITTTQNINCQEDLTVSLSQTSRPSLCKDALQPKTFQKPEPLQSHDVPLSEHSSTPVPILRPDIPESSDNKPLRCILTQHSPQQHSQDLTNPFKKPTQQKQIKHFTEGTTSNEEKSYDLKTELFQDPLASATEISVERMSTHTDTKNVCASPTSPCGSEQMALSTGCVLSQREVPRIHETCKKTLNCHNNLVSHDSNTIEAVPQTSFITNKDHSQKAENLSQENIAGDRSVRIQRILSGNNIKPYMACPFLNKLKDGHDSNDFQRGSNIDKPFIRPIKDRILGTRPGFNKDKQINETATLNQHTPDIRLGSMDGENQILQNNREPPQGMSLKPSEPTIPLQKNISDISLLTAIQSYQSEEDMGNTPPPSYFDSLKYPKVQESPRHPVVTSMAQIGEERRSPTISFIKIHTNRQGNLVYTPFTCSASQSDLFPTNLEDDRTNQDGRRCSRDHFSDHQILALLACIIFWPLGLMAVYYANMADVLRSGGKHAKSLEYSKRALVLSLGAFVTGTGIYLIFCLQGGYIF